MSSDTDARRSELGDRLAEVEERVSRACADAGRQRSAVTVVVVTKTWPASDVRLLAELGVREVAENREQELRHKVRECADRDLRWHFVGQLQSNKARSVARHVDVVHSVDRLGLVGALGRGAAAAGRTVGCLVQVALSAEPGVLGTRGGAAPEDVPALADAVAGTEGLSLAGIMAVAPHGQEPAEAFARLGEVAVVVRRAHPGATHVSAGMSGDLEAAVAAGATHLRVGTAVLGTRPRLG